MLRERDANFATGGVWRGVARSATPSRQIPTRCRPSDSASPDAHATPIPPPLRDAMRILRGVAQALADADTDLRADLYSFGVLAYEPFCGRLRFDAHTSQEMFAAHLTVVPPRVPERRPDVPPEVDRLTREPASRWHAHLAALRLPCPYGRLGACRRSRLRPRRLVGPPVPMGPCHVSRQFSRPPRGPIHQACPRTRGGAGDTPRTSRPIH